MAKKKVVKKTKKAKKKKVVKKTSASIETPKTKPAPVADIKKKVVKKKKKKKKITKKIAGKCFVMMPFKTPFDIYYTTIFKPAIKAANLDPIRADDLFRPSVIVSDLWEMVQSAKVLLAELTTKNANVFYELGLAHAIGKPVVLVSETMDDVPFDLQQLRVILYNKDNPAWGDELSSSITSFLKDTLQSPDEAVPSIFKKKVESKAPTQDATISRIEALERAMRLMPRESRLARPMPNIEEELIDVDTPEELDRWILKWSRRGYKQDSLEKLILRSDKIPSFEVNRVEKMFNKKRVRKLGKLGELEPVMY